MPSSNMGPELEAGGGHIKHGGSLQGKGKILSLLRLQGMRWVGIGSVGPIPTQPWHPGLLGSALAGWYNADDHSNTNLMTDDGAGLISSWKSRVGALAITGTTTARPTWTSNAWTPNSKAGVTLNGTANVLASSGTGNLPVGATSGEMWVLWTDTQSHSTNNFFFAYGGTLASNGRYFATNGSGNPFISDGTINFVNTTPTLAAGSHIFGGYWDAANAVEGARWDGADFTQPTTAIAALNTGTTRLVLGRAISLAGAFYTGIFRHMLIINGLLTVTQRQQMEGYLAWDGWNSAAANPLPASHPYKNAPP